MWSGSFASFAEVAPGEAPRVVAGCWASVFGPDALARSEAAGREPGSLEMAVIIQPEIVPRFGGTARLIGGGAAEVVGVEGSPGALVSGWERGHVARVSPDGEVAMRAPASPIPKALFQEVAALAVKAAGATGCTSIEWAADAEGLWLLQVLSGTERRSVPDAETTPSAPLEARHRGLLEQVVRWLIEWPGPIGDELILPWALGTATVGPQAPAGCRSPEACWAEAVQIAGSLVAARFGGSADGAGEGPRRLLHAVRGSEDLRSAMESLSALPTVAPITARHVVGLLESVAGGLAVAGRIPGTGWIRHLSPEDVAALVSGERTRLDPTRRIGRGAWEPFLAAAVAALGTSEFGEPVVPGIGAGPVRLIRSASDAERFEPREVVLSLYPLNNLAPLLWDAAAVVSLGGSPGAHVFEVASSLNVPAVCGLEIPGGLADLAPASEGGRRLVATVDGGAGRVTLARV
jgi:hypothetical protein